MKLSVVILNYNVRYFLELCLKSVEAATKSIDAEVIVVDNNSSDDSCSMVKELFPEVILIENKTNFGFSKGNNIGVAEAKGDFICILNPDTVIGEDTFIQLLAYADNMPRLGVLGCRLIDGSGHYLPESKRNVPVPKVSFNKIFGSGQSYYASHLGETDIGPVDVLVGAFMLLKRDLYNQMNGFDEDYFMYGEDIDVSYRILKAGYKNQYYGKQTIIHFKGESTPKNKYYRKRFYEAMKIFYNKHFKNNIVLDILVALGSKLIPLFEKKSVTGFSSKSEQMIFDNNDMSFSEIISAFEKQSGNFKIRPRGANYIIGSSNAKNKGEVVDMQ